IPCRWEDTLRRRTRDSALQLPVTPITSPHPTTSSSPETLKQGAPPHSEEWHPYQATSLHMELIPSRERAPRPLPAHWTSPKAFEPSRPTSTTFWWLLPAEALPLMGAE